MLCSMTGRLNAGKMSVLPKLIKIFTAIPIKIPARVYVVLDKLILKFIQKDKGMCVCVWVCVYAKLLQSRPTLCDPMDFSPGLCPGKNTGMGCHALLQGIFLTQGSN